MLTLSKAISGINPDNVHCLGIDGGSDIEELEHWRQRVPAFNKGVLVGRRNDYEAWARSAHAAVDFAWALDNTLSVEWYKSLLGLVKTTPLPASVVDAVQSYIDAERLAGCHPIVHLPVQKPIASKFKMSRINRFKPSIIIALESLFKRKWDNVMDLYYHQDQSQFHLQKLY